MKMIFAACLAIVTALAEGTPTMSAPARELQSSHFLFPVAGGGAVVSSTCSTGGAMVTAQIKKTTSAVPGFSLVNDAPFTRTSTRQPAVQRLYRIACSLPAIHALQRTSCVADWGVAYHLTFWRGQVRVLNASVEAGGCAILYRGSVIGRGPAFSMLGPVYSRFWCAVAKTLNVPEADLFAYPAPRQGPTEEERLCTGR